MGHFMRATFALIPLFLLSACLLTPGKFLSSLDIRKDGTFTFAYKGEVIAKDFEKEIKELGKESPNTKQEGEHDYGDEQNIAYSQQISTKNSSANEEQDKDKALKIQAIAQALSKEKGYRSVRYIGNGKFDIDYQISGRLDHSFLFPFNVDAQAVFPFIAVEVRADGKVRVQAPGFANDNSKSNGPMGSMSGDEAKDLDGTFTLMTDAEIVSQNQENGTVETSEGKQIMWKVTPLTHVVPMAVLRIAATH